MIRKGLKYILLLLSVLTVGCTKENLDDCFSGVHLRFRFTLHEESAKGNLFGQNVWHMRVYVFDEKGVLQRIETERGAVLTNDYVMPLDLKPGHYSIVAWASDNVDFFYTYNQLHAVDFSMNPPQYKELEIGKSRMEDLRVMLDCEEAAGYPEEIKPKINNFDDLYFGAVGTRSNDGASRYTIVPVEVRYGELAEREVELIRNTNIIRVTIEGTEHLSDGSSITTPQEMFDIWATGSNSRYQYNNCICPEALSVRYLPQYSQPGGNAVQADVKTERMEWIDTDGKGVKLNVRLKNGKYLFTGDLLSLLRDAKNEQGSYIYKNQEDLDRIYIHPIRFVIGGGDDSHDLYVKIFVHNWELITLIPEI